MKQTRGRRRSRILEIWKRLDRRLKARPDKEHMMSMNRGVFTALFAVFLFIAKPEYYQVGLLVTYIGAFVTIAIFLHILWRPASNPVRRLLALGWDLGAIFYLMHLGGALGSILYPFILWTAFGNALRFGLPWLTRATVIGVLGFLVVVATTQFWLDHTALTVGLTAGIAVLPLYAAALLRNLSAAKAQAEAANEAKTLFLARVSHELRTPLHAIIGTGSLLETSNLPRPQVEMARTIMDASRSLLALIDDLLQISAIETGKFPIHIVEIDVLALLGDIKALVQVSARSKGLRIALHVDRDTPRYVSSDDRRLREILMNLSSNAIKFTDAGGVLINVLVVDRSALRARLRFEVIDTGIGIPPEAHARIFERFTQADTTIHARFGGTGLGLALCKQLIETMGGQIGVQSEASAGSTFWFEIECPIVAGASSAAAGPARTLVTVGLDARSAGEVEKLAASLNAEVRRASADPAEIKRVLLSPAGGRDAVILFPAERQELARAVAAILRDLPTDRVAGAVVIGADRLTDGTDLRWAVPVAVPRGFSQQDLAAAVNIAVELSRGHAGDSATPPAAMRTPRRPRRVLVADDSRINQQVVARILESAGHSYELVSDGDGALDALEAEPFDIVLMDVNMKGTDGIEATRLYRFTALGQRHVPIIALTADATPEMAQRCLDAGMDRCVVKPVSADALLDIIDAAIGEDAAVAAAPDLASSRPLQTDIPVFDEDQIESLRDLGGQDFISQVVEDFVEDAKNLIEGLRIAVDRNEISGFRNNAHALASASANLGATRVRRLGLLMERFSADEFSAHGKVKAREIEYEVGRLVEASRVGRRQEVSYPH